MPIPTWAEVLMTLLAVLIVVPSYSTHYQNRPHSPLLLKIKLLNLPFRVCFCCADRPSDMVSYVQEPSICIVLQRSEIYLGTECQYFDDSHLMFCPVNIPISLHIEHATIETPVIVLSMKLNLTTIREVLAKIPPSKA